ncbi:putative GMC oxidoreductase [Podospora fimiseda]|uniref:GMC oxidoreductase n=1 Tax=Podospora fimiseda TaxID=252190 RepID=A0AAN6YN32_9PEZI|nr:putative GMC oxidoreductase [Podospora fimiseda]
MHTKMRYHLLSLTALVAIVQSASLGKVSKHATLVKARTVTETQYDFIIAGGGIAGLTVADRLTEDPDVKVLVIESGPFDQDEYSLLTPGAFFTTFPANYMWLPLPSTPQTALQNKVFNVPAGKVVGGGSVINAMVFTRPSKEQLKDWDTLGAKGWDWNSLLPYYKKSESFTPPDPAYAQAANFSFNPSVHGQDGPVEASYPNFAYPGAGVWFEAAVASGIQAGGDANDGDGMGVVTTPFVTSGTTRTRSHARLNHYTPVQSRTNYHILDSHTVSRILFDNNKKAIGVEYLPTAGGSTLTVNATKEVLVAAGALHSPQILQLSGVGPKSLLQGLNIPVVVDLPGVGANLQDQPSIIIPYNVTNNIHPNIGTLSTDPAYDAAQRALFDATREGPYQLTRGLSNNLALPSLSKTTPTLAKCQSILDAARAANHNTYLPPGTHPSVARGYKLQRELTIKQLSGDKTAVSMIHWDTANSVRMYFLRPFSRGSVTISSTNPLAWPVIDFQTFVDPIDQDLVVASFLKNRHIMSQPSMAALNPLEAAPFDNSITDEQTLKAILSGITEPSSAHQCCTAAMMPMDMGGVVDNDMKVYGVKGVRVIDTSFWPMVLTSAPTATTYAVGEKIADVIKKEYCLGGFKSGKGKGPGKC